MNDGWWEGESGSDDDRPSVGRIVKKPVGETSNGRAGSPKRPDPWDDFLEAAAFTVLLGVAVGVLLSVLDYFFGR